MSLWEGSHVTRAIFFLVPFIWCQGCSDFFQPVTACSFSPAQMFLALNQTNMFGFPVCSIPHMRLTERVEENHRGGDAAGAWGTAGDHKSYPNSWPLKRTFCVLVLQSSLLNRLVNKVWLSDTSLSSFYQSCGVFRSQSVYHFLSWLKKMHVWEHFPGYSCPIGVFESKPGTSTQFRSWASLSDANWDTFKG